MLNQIKSTVVSSSNTSYKSYILLTENIRYNKGNNKPDSGVYVKG